MILSRRSFLKGLSSLVAGVAALPFAKNVSTPTLETGPTIKITGPVQNPEIKTFRVSDGGNFMSVIGSANYIAKWNGDAWKVLDLTNAQIDKTDWRAHYGNT